MSQQIDVEREIVAYEVDGLRALRKSMLRWMESASGGGLALQPHQRPSARRLAEKRTAAYFDYVEQVLGERIARGAVVINESKWQ